MNERKKERKGEHQMHGHEKIFFSVCYNLAVVGVKPRAIVRALNDTIPRRRCWYYLRKWQGLGIYEYGTRPEGPHIDMGWFVPFAKMPARYREILEEKE